MRDSYNNSLDGLAFLAVFYVVASIGPQLLEETTGLHIDKYLGLIAGPATLFVLYILIGITRTSDTMMMVLPLFVLFLFILMIKTVNQHFLGNSSWIYAIAIPIVLFYVSNYAYNLNKNRPNSENTTFLEKILTFLQILPAIYVIGIAILHIYIYFILGKNYKLLN